MFTVAVSQAYAEYKTARDARLAVLERLNTIRPDAGALRGLRGKAYSQTARIVEADLDARRAPLLVELDAATERFRLAVEALHAAKVAAGMV